MKRNLDEADQSARMAIGGAIITLGLMRRKWWTILGLYPYITGSMKYCPLKNFFEEANKLNLSKAEINDQPIEGEDGSGGYRVGDPATGSVSVGF